MMARNLLAAAACATLVAGAAMAADNEAGVPLRPSEAAGGWTVERNGRTICMITLSAAKAGAAGFGARPDERFLRFVPGNVLARHHGHVAAARSRR